MNSYQSVKLEIDKTTGELLEEVIRTYSITPFIAPVEAVQSAPAQKAPQTPLSLEHIQDALRLKAASNDARIATQEPTDNNVTALPTKRITRPKKVTFNKIAMHVSLADVEERSSNGQPLQNWVEDYVMGACYTIAKANNGKLNVSPSHIFAAVKMDIISTESVGAAFRNFKGEPLGKTQVALIGQCARYALNGMQMYLDRNPTLYEALQAEVDFIATFNEQGQEQAA